jgi:hypothetical protein
MDIRNEIKELKDNIENQKQIIQQQEEKLYELEKELKESKVEEFKRWRASKMEYYYFLNVNGDTIKSGEMLHKHDNYRYSIGNYFETKEECEYYKNKLLATQRLKDLALRLNEGWKPDWNNFDEEKWFIYYDYKYEEYNCNRYYLFYKIPNTYFKSEEIGKKAMELMGNDLDYIFDIRR